MDIKEAKTAVKAIFLQAASMSGFEVTDQSPARFSDLIQKGFSKVAEKRKPEAVANILRVIASTLEEAQKDKLKILSETSVDKGKKKVCPVYPFN